MRSLTRILNLVYAFLTEGADEQAVKDFDRELAADPALIAKVGKPSKGADALMAFLGGGKKPAPAGGRS